MFSSTDVPVPNVTLVMPGWKQRWANSDACESPITPQIGTGSGRAPSTSVAPNSAALSRTSGSARIGTSNRPHSSSSQRSRPDVEQQRAAGVGVIGREHLPAGEAVDQVRVDRADQRVARRPGCAARSGRSRTSQVELRRREIGVDLQPGLAPDRRLVPGVGELPADRRRRAGTARRWRCAAAGRSRGRTRRTSRAGW